MKCLLVAAAAALLLLAPLAGDAAVTNTPAFVQTPQIKAATFVQGTDSAGTYKTVYAGGANGSKITGLWATSNDGSASHLITIQISSSASAHCSPQSGCFGGVAITIPSNAGFANGAPTVNLLSAANWPGLPIDSDGNPYVYLPSSSYTIEATFGTALTASTQLAVVGQGGDF